MSSLDLSTRPAYGRHPGFVAQIIARFVAWNDLRATQRSLEKLSDRELDDIGLTRFDVVHMR